MYKNYYFPLLFFAVVLAGCGRDNGGDYLEASGTLEARYITLSAKTAGQITLFRPEEGDRIRMGDTIAVIDPEGPRIQLDAAQAAKEAAEAQLALLESGARREDIAQAEAGLAQAKLSLAQADADKMRFEQLLKSSSSTRKQFDDAALRAALAKEQCLAAEENLKKIKQISRPEEIRQARARVAQTAAAVAAARKTFSDAFIISPADGILVDKFCERGESVSPLSALVKLSDLSTMYLMIYLPEADVAKVALGSSVDVFIDAYKDKPFSGKVVFINPESEFTPKNIQTNDERTKLVFGVKIEIVNPELKLKAGLPADARITVKN